MKYQNLGLLIKNIKAFRCMLLWTLGIRHNIHPVRVRCVCACEDVQVWPYIIHDQAWNLWSLQCLGLIILAPKPLYRCQNNHGYTYIILETVVHRTNQQTKCGQHILRIALKYITNCDSIYYELCQEFHYELITQKMLV